LRGIEVNEYMQSVSNPAIYAAGDAAASEGPPLTPVAAYQNSISADRTRLRPASKHRTLPKPITERGTRRINPSGPTVGCVSAACQSRTGRRRSCLSRAAKRS
jgi:NADPH-dependent 2,4-dienoyl-CoA reductase/sulfur reductase-like enzyme